MNGRWWMYKAGTPEEHFTELFAYHLGTALQIPIALYERDGQYIRTLDFTDGAAVDFETAFGIIGEETEYPAVYDKLREVDRRLAGCFVSMAYFDALIFNMDRHEHNFGILRNAETGEILGMAPLYDHNIVLISRGYPRDITRKHDRLIEDFVQLIQERNISFAVPELSETAVEEAILKTDIPLPRSAAPAAPDLFIKEYLLNGQKRIQDLLQH